MMNARIFSALKIYFVIVFILFYLKPDFLFDESGNLRHFGVDDNTRESSILSLPMLVILIGITSYFIVCAIEYLEKYKLVV